MPPSTATYVRTPGISLIVPTRYSVRPAGATIERPGSVMSRGRERTPASASALSHASRTVALYAAIVGAASSAR